MTPRPASFEDAAPIAALERRCTTHPWSAESVADSLALPSVRGWVLEDGGAHVGHALASAAGGTGEILLVAVDPAARRRGFGRVLLETAHAWWREQGVRTAFLEVRADNVAARALYRNLGWADVGVRPRYYRDGTDAALMRWEAP